MGLDCCHSCLSLLALDPATAATVPDEVRIAGSSVSFEEVRDIVARVKGVEKGKIVSEDLAAHKKALSEKPGEDFLGYLRSVVSVCCRSSRTLTWLSVQGAVRRGQGRLLCPELE